jgi:2-polyprenyl-3-methyl-5-hydroxy-6-metoxy-1,4-benzoquinol methylase
MISRLRNAVGSYSRALQLSRTNAESLYGIRPSTAEMVARQNGPSGYARADLFVHYLAIQEAEGSSEGGIALLQKLVENAPEGRKPDRALLAVLRRDSLPNSLFIPTKIVVDAKLNLLSNPVPLAVAIHSGESEVAATIKITARGRITPPRYDSQWLTGIGFTADEVARVEAAQGEVFEKLRILSLPWETFMNLRKEMRGLLPKGVKMHGRGDLYQTCQELLLPGQRPTALRFREYDLAAILKPSDRVLDIGCNCGFLALHTSRFVKHVDGFDAAAHFIAIAGIAKKYLERENCTFTASSFSEFSTSESYDVIFSFAVHHWIGMPIPDYAARLLELLKPGGLVLLESQDLSTHDQDWDEKLRQFCSAGFEEVRSGTMSDDGLIARRHVLLRDTRAAISNVAAR